jgi:hypothetical protein
VDIIAREVVVLLTDLVRRVPGRQQIHHEFHADARAFDHGLSDEHVRIGNDSTSPVHEFLPEPVRSLCAKTLAGNGDCLAEHARQVTQQTAESLLDPGAEKPTIVAPECHSRRSDPTTERMAERFCVEPAGWVRDSDSR